MITGLTSGSFDLFHASHFIYLERCRALCDKLYVGVDDDRLVKSSKGALRPINSQYFRMNLVSALPMVDAAFLLSDVEELTKIAYTFVVDKVFKCEKWEKKKGVHVYGTEKAELVIVRDIPGMISTTDIINAIKEGKTCLASGPLPDRSVEGISWLDEKSS